MIKRKTRCFLFAVLSLIASLFVLARPKIQISPTLLGKVFLANSIEEEIKESKRVFFHGFVLARLSCSAVMMVFLQSTQSWTKSAD